MGSDCSVSNMFRRVNFLLLLAFMSLRKWMRQSNSGKGPRDTRHRLAISCPDQMDNSEMNNMGFLDMMNVETGDMSWGGTPDCSPIGEQATMPTQNVASSARPRPAKGSSTKGKNWSTDEDKVLIKAWAHTSLDAVTGTDQNASSYWGRISAYYNEHKEPHWPERNANALGCRYNTISALTSKFCGCVQQILNRNESGRTLDDKQRDAHEMFVALDPKKKPFTLMHCYIEFEQHPKWKTRDVEKSKKQKKTYDASPGSTSNDEDFGVCTDALEKEQRPRGTKYEKERRG